MYPNNRWPLPFASFTNHESVGVVIILLAVFLYGWAAVTFGRAGTTVDLTRPTTAIATGGPYRFSRNPIYISLTLFSVGLAIGKNNLWTLAFTVPALIIVHYAVVLKEEDHLTEIFGDTYVQYKNSVRRWL